MHLLRRPEAKVRRLSELAAPSHLPRRLVRRVAQVADEVTARLFTPLVADSPDLAERMRRAA